MNPGCTYVRADQMQPATADFSATGTRLEQASDSDRVSNIAT